MAPKTVAKISIGVVTVMACAWFGFSAWRDAVVDRQRARASEAVEGLLADERWLEARGAVKEFWRTFGSKLSQEEERRWRALDITTSERTGDLARLVWLESEFPDLMRENESASLLVVRTFAAAGQPDDAERVRDAWRGREQKPSWWFYWEVDQLIAAGNSEEVRMLLEGRRFEGEADAGRLLRLALLARNPIEAWSALQKAVEQDPRNVDARSFRAQMLERAGATEQAQVEYVSALVADPQDIVRRDQLAQFYLRHGNATQALQTWREGLTPAAPDFLWLRVMLWERLHGGTGDAIPEPAVGNWTELIGALDRLPADVFWNDAALMEPVLKRRAAVRPEVVLLGVLELLKSGQEMEALERITALNDETAALAPVGFAAIKAVLRWRLLELQPDFGFLPQPAPGVVEHDVMTQLRNWPAEGLSEEMKGVVLGDHVWSAMMLAIGWPQAAVIMAEAETDDSDAPSWWHYGITVALDGTRGRERALAHLQSVSDRGPTLQLLDAELKWESDPSAARSESAKLATLQGNTGFRAAWLLATDALQNGDASRAVAVIRAQPQLESSLAGKELLARAELAAGNASAAGIIYRELGVNSLEAGMWLARQAFTAQDWDEARELTLALIDRFPTQVELRANLEKIDEAMEAADGVQP
ncbi:MAG: hypothetical protein SynsKO_00360 [Synoicihabitans sp.]